MRAERMSDYYENGAYLRQWGIQNGWPVCVDTALAVADTGQAQRDAVLGENAACRDKIAAVEAYEQALIFLARYEEPPVGNSDYDAALAVRDGADQAVLDLHADRQGEGP